MYLLCPSFWWQWAIDYRAKMFSLHFNSFLSAWKIATFSWNLIYTSSTGKIHFNDLIKILICCPYPCTLDLLQAKLVHRFFYCRWLWICIISFTTSLICSIQLASTMKKNKVREHIPRVAKLKQLSSDQISPSYLFFTDFHFIFQEI